MTHVYLHSPSEAPDALVVATTMPEFEGLGDRSLLLARPGDVVCLAQPADAGYLEFLRSLSLGPRGEDVLVIPGVAPGTGLSARLLAEPAWVDRLADRLGSGGPLWLSPFFTTPAAERLAAILEARLGRTTGVLGGPARLSRSVHDKRVARRLARRLGIPVAPGDTVRMVREHASPARSEAALRRAILRRSEETGRAIIRGASGASGSSTFLADAARIEAVVEAIASRRDNTSWLVQPLYEVAASPNVEVAVKRRAGGPVTATDQILDECLVYLGSAFPSRAGRAGPMVAAGRVIADWLRKRGFVGHVGFDFVESAPGTSASPWFLTEINPRINGATYPVSLLRRLARLAARCRASVPGGFRTGPVASGARDFHELARWCDGLLYDPARGEGIIPYAVANLALGKVGIAAFARSRERACAIFADVASAAPESRAGPSRRRQGDEVRR